METPIYVLLSQQTGLERQMSVTAQNMANISTSGFKSRDVMFEDYIVRPSTKSQTHFVLDRATLRNTSQGPLMHTGNPLDMAISGNGYFTIQTPEGKQYSRQGNFQIDSEGNLVTADGFKVLSADGQGITIPNNAQQVSIGLDGTISTDAGDAGRLQPVTFQREQEMLETYNGYYSTSEAGQPDSASTVNQGMVESSNVKPIQEMTHVIEISRAYQRVANLISSENDRLKNAIHTLGQPT